MLSRVFIEAQPSWVGIVVIFRPIYFFFTAALLYHFPKDFYFQNIWKDLIKSYEFWLMSFFIVHIVSWLTKFFRNFSPFCPPCVFLSHQILTPFTHRSRIRSQSWFSWNNPIVFLKTITRGFLDKNLRDFLSTVECYSYWTCYPCRPETHIIDCSKSKVSLKLPRYGLRCRGCLSRIIAVTFEDCKEPPNCYLNSCLNISAADNQIYSSKQNYFWKLETTHKLKLILKFLRM